MAMEPVQPNHEQYDALLRKLSGEAVSPQPDWVSMIWWRDSEPFGAMIRYHAKETLNV